MWRRSKIIAVENKSRTFYLKAKMVNLKLLLWPYLTYMTVSISILVLWIYALYDSRTFSTLPLILTMTLCVLYLCRSSHVKQHHKDTTNKHSKWILHMFDYSWKLNSITVLSFIIIKYNNACITILLSLQCKCTNIINKRCSNILSIYIII